MSEEKLKRCIIVSIVFIMLFIVVGLFTMDGIRKYNYKKSEKFTNAIIDDVVNYYSQQEYKTDYILFKDGNLSSKGRITTGYKTNLTLPEDGFIDINEGEVYAVVYNNQYCTYKRYNEGALTTEKIKNYDDCLKLSEKCPENYNFDNGYCVE